MIGVEARTTTAQERNECMFRNVDIREEAALAGVKLWQIADALGITDSNFSRKLRKELSDGTKEEIRGIIKRISEEVS